MSYEDVSWTELAQMSLREYSSELTSYKKVDTDQTNNITGLSCLLVR
jgi:hypothetical protein